MMGQRRARIAVIGTGWWATYTHIPALLERSDVELVALANRGGERLRRAAETYRVDITYTDYREMLDREELDGVVVSVAQPAHYETAKAALERGCHILLEKPMVLKTGEAKELVELASRNGLEIVMSYPRHYNRHVRRAREAVLSGELGGVQLVSSQFASTAYETYRGNVEAYVDFMEVPVMRVSRDTNMYHDRGGGQGYVQVTHSAAAAFWVTGLAAQRVTAHMSNLDVAVDVVDAISMRFTNGAVGSICSTGNLRPGDPGQDTLSVYCSEGYLLLDLVAGTLMIRKHDGTIEEPDSLATEDILPRFAPVNNLVDVILGKGENESPGENGRVTVNFLDAAYRSASGGGVAVDVVR